MPRIIDLDRRWLFQRGELLRTNRLGGMDDYRPRVHWTKSGRHEPSLPGYDATTWRTVEVPHDWAIEGLPDPTTDVNHGSRVGGVAWYRQVFTLPACVADQRLWLEFDGVYRDCEVWVNGAFAGANRGGYIGFRIDVSELARPGADNTVAVRVDASEFEGWWYEGAGIYRAVRLVTAPPVHLTPDGIRVTTRLFQHHAEVGVEVEVTNSAATAALSVVTLQLADPTGRLVATATGSVHVAADGTSRLALTLSIGDPLLWTPTTPTLYRLTASLSQDAQEGDRTELDLGLRTIAVDAERGFLLNGQPLKLTGVSCHQDFAGVGVALPDALQTHRVQLLKRMGANAYRTAHHAPSPALLDACDRLGLLVMDETRIFATSDEALSQLERLVRRDRHRPCVALWSLGNEEMELQGTAVGVRIARRMRRLVHALDGSRPVTLAMNGEWFGPLAADPTCVDVVGFNYSPTAYDDFHRQRPGRPLIGSETAAGLATRGVHAEVEAQGHLTWEQHVAGCRPRPAHDQDPGHCRADGDTCASFGDTPWDAWRAVAERDFVMGTFIWTGFDYRGEPCPRQLWPCINTNFGLTDLCGFPKDIWWYYRAWWQPTPVLHLLPHWDWNGREGQLIAVRCFANAQQVELFHKGISHGVQIMPLNGFLEWQVPYVAGRLEAVGTWADGSQQRTVVETTHSAARVAVSYERPATGRDGREVVLLRLAIQDTAGREIPTASHQVRLRLEGAGRILGVHNGDPAFIDAEQADRVRLFNGLALAVLELTPGGGDLDVHLHADGVAAAQVHLSGCSSLVSPVTGRRLVTSSCHHPAAAAT